jgi:hypothetical protein
MPLTFEEGKALFLKGFCGISLVVYTPRGSKRSPLVSIVLQQ